VWHDVDMTKKRTTSQKHGQNKFKAKAKAKKAAGLAKKKS
jgi:hypothetical protein